MKNNVFKGSIVILIFLLFLISVTVVASADENSDLNILSLSQSGITIQYPSDWGNSRATSNYSVMAISKIDSIDALGIGQVNINIEKKPVEGDFYTFVNDTYDDMQRDSSFQLISSGFITEKNSTGFPLITRVSPFNSTLPLKLPCMLSLSSKYFA